MTHKLLRTALLALATLPALAQTKTQTKPIRQPETPTLPFTVWQLRPNATDETQVTSTTLNPQGFWLLAYVDLKSPATQTLLTQLQTLVTDPPQPAPPQTTVRALDPTKLVIVAANATGAELTAFALKYPALAQSAWTYDLKHQAAHILNIPGTPHLLGMHEGRQRWQYAGALPPATLQPLVLTWTTLNTLPPNKLSLAKPTRPQTSTRTPVPVPAAAK